MGRDEEEEVSRGVDGDQEVALTTQQANDVLQQQVIVAASGWDKMDRKASANQLPPSQPPLSVPLIPPVFWNSSLLLLQISCLPDNHWSSSKHVQTLSVCLQKISHAAEVLLHPSASCTSPCNAAYYVR